MFTNLVIPSPDPVYRVRCADGTNRIVWTGTLESCQECLEAFFEQGIPVYMESVDTCVVALPVVK